MVKLAFHSFNVFLAPSHLTEPLYLAIPPSNVQIEPDPARTTVSPSYRFSELSTLSPALPDYFYRAAMSM